jgi:hypothetical protein
MNTDYLKPNGAPSGALLKRNNQMKTEIDTLKTAWRDYANAKSIEEFNAAEKVLLKFHNKYGTIDIPTIKSLIQ